MKNEIKSTHYKHAEKATTYLVIGQCKIKNPETREWEDGVIYQADPLPLGEKQYIYVRTETDFRERFTEVRDPDASEGPNIRTH